MGRRAGAGGTPGIRTADWGGMRDGGKRAIGGGGRGGKGSERRGAGGTGRRGAAAPAERKPRAPQRPRGADARRHAAPPPPEPRPPPGAPRAPTWRSRGGARSPGAAPPRFRPAACPGRSVMTSLAGDGESPQQRTTAHEPLLWRCRRARAVAIEQHRSGGRCVETRGVSGFPRTAFSRPVPRSRHFFKARRTSLSSSLCPGSCGATSAGFLLRGSAEQQLFRLGSADGL